MKPIITLIRHPGQVEGVNHWLAESCTCAATEGHK
jgi:hypothetical protein